MGIGTIIGGFASSEAADNERKVQERNQSLWNDYRNQVLNEFYKSRGSEGNAVLPLFFGTGNDSFETKLANDFKSLYGSLPSIDPSRYQATIDSFVPMQMDAKGTLADVFNGNNTSNRLRYFQPVANARTSSAKGQQEAILEGLSQRLNALNSDSARKGYSGTGSFAQNRLLGATIGARQQAAGAMSAANLANADDIRNINDQGLNLKLNNLNTPYQMANNSLAFVNMPNDMAVNAFASRLQPLSFFRIGTATPNVVAPMPEKAIPTDSQIWLQAGADLAQEGEDTAKQAAMAYFGGGMGGLGGGGGGGGGGSRVPTYTGSQTGGWGYGGGGGGYGGGYMPMPMYS